MNVCFGQGHTGLGNQLGDSTISHKLPLRHQRPLITLPGRSFFPVPCLLSISPNRNPLLCFISPPPQALPKPRTPLPIHTDLQAPICHPPTSCSLLPPESFFWSPHGAITFPGWYKGQMFAHPSKVRGGTCTHTTSHLPWGHYLGIVTLGSNEWPEVARLGDPQSFPQTSALPKDQNILPEHVGTLTGLCFAHVGPLYLHSCQEEDGQGHQHAAIPSEGDEG